MNPVSNAQFGLQFPGAKNKTPHFGNRLKQDRTVLMNLDVPVTRKSAADVLHQLLFQNLAKKQAGETSSLKLILDTVAAGEHIFPNAAALVDAMLLQDRPTDVVITSALGPGGLRGLLQATGKRFITSGAYICMGPQEMKRAAGRTTNHEGQNRRDWINTYQHDLEWMVMRATGKTSRKEVAADLADDHYLTSLDALAYGSKGLVDYILVGHDKVLTREKLDAYYKDKGLTTERDKHKFNQDQLNIENIPAKYLVSLASVSPDSIPSANFAPGITTTALGKKAEEAKAETETADKEADAAIKKPDTDENPFAIQALGDVTDTEAKPVTLPAHVKIQDLKSPGDFTPERFLLENLPNGVPEILNGDIINFTTPFTTKTGQQLVDALETLGQDKIERGDYSPIKLFINSPGGSVLACQDIRTTLRDLKDQGILVDVMTSGMAASGGSWTMCSATGQRMATPTAKVMVHQANTTTGKDQEQSVESYNSDFDTLSQMTEVYAHIVAQASGRSFEDVMADYNDNDKWLNPVEAMFYGDKGLIDSIVVGPDRVITRDAMASFLTKKLGLPDRAAFDAYAKKAIDGKRQTERVSDVEEWEELYGADPFKNPLATIQAVVDAGGASPLPGSNADAKVHNLIHIYDKESLNQAKG